MRRTSSAGGRPNSSKSRMIEAAIRFLMVVSFLDGESRHHLARDGTDAISSQIVTKGEACYISVESFQGVGDASICASAHVVGRCGAAHGWNELRGCRR